MFLCGMCTVAVDFFVKITLETGVRGVAIIKAG